MRASIIALILVLAVSASASQLTVAGTDKHEAVAIRLEAENIALKRQLLDAQERALQQRASGFVEAQRVKLGAKTDAVFNWDTLTFVSAP